MTRARDRAETWLLALLLIAGAASAALVLVPSSGKRDGTAEDPTEPDTPPAVDRLQVSVDPGSAKTRPAGGRLTVNVTVLGPPATFAWLNRSGCPPQAGCWFSVWEGTVPFASALFVATGDGTPEGQYRVTVRVSSTAEDATAPFNLSVVRLHVVTFQKGDGGLYNETDDAQISSAFPTTNNGTDTPLQVDGAGCLGSSESFACKVLVKFPQAFGPNAGQVPIGARVERATLQVYVLNEGPSEDFVQVSEAWEESTVTWNGFASPGSPKTVGESGQFVPSPRGFHFVDVTIIAQRWADGDPNEGLLFAGHRGDRRLYHSSEYWNVPLRPKLTVAYENATMPSGPSLADDPHGFAPAGTVDDLSGTGNRGTIMGLVSSKKTIPGSSGFAKSSESTENVIGDWVLVPEVDMTAKSLKVPIRRE